MSHQESFGIMDEGYFVPRTQILTWLNDLLQLDLTKIEQLGSGAVYCQVIDVMHPGKVPMQKINWKAKNDYEFISNMKILQNAFDKTGIKRYVEVQKLARAKYQDNLEFIQWLKRYYDKNCGLRPSDYNAHQKRGGALLDFTFADKNVVPKTYNGAGLITTPKNEPMEKPKKKEEALKEVRSTSNKPKETNNRPTILKDATKGSNLNQNKSSTIYEQKIKELEMKLAMVTQIVKSQDKPEMKVNMISEIVESSLQTDKEQQNRRQELRQEEDLCI